MFIFFTDYIYNIKNALMKIWKWEEKSSDAVSQLQNELLSFIELSDDTILANECGKK